MTAGPVRIGTLGAAAITANALIKPARIVDDATVVAIAARDQSRAREYAAKHGIAKVHASYEDVIADPEVDAIYNPLPNSHHGYWTLRAIEAGKHVLCEKPFTANAAEAARVAAAASGAPSLTVIEAFHYRYHPLVRRMLELIADGAVGNVRHIAATMAFPLRKADDIRWQLDLAGGALMDAGCYPVHLVRTLGGAQPEVVSASALERFPGVDRRMDASLRFPDGTTGSVVTSMWSSKFLRVSAKVTGDKGTLRVLNPYAPHMVHVLFVNGRPERVRGEATYTHQLRAFTGAILRGEPVLTAPDTAVDNMLVIDAMYQAAGMPLRVGLTDAQ